MHGIGFQGLSDSEEASTLWEKVTNLQSLGGPILTFSDVEKMLCEGIHNEGPRHSTLPTVKREARENTDLSFTSAPKHLINPTIHPQQTWLLPM